MNNDSTLRRRITARVAAASLTIGAVTLLTVPAAAAPPIGPTHATNHNGGGHADPRGGGDRGYGHGRGGHNQLHDDNATVKGHGGGDGYIPPHPHTH
ncbi:hypothetical protein [Nocardia seriolae]|uniref:Uncharacterized protein n=1 Tax=Nocardia seriolae TaxID=37332 RepID=A0A0B8NNE6_9NOCA|nr:hypothetical protein [Nocardia seriolae]APA97112.1 hypothetical protein NS506_03056 [Nocardia seriolae]MTJ65100.1 hypothetical protein [Nocardia seriolae]MTJ74877.1 hypothetical protein [Nocardia seriolae]MTJ86975.1 hypothetical protein [Nocardia seriolae]MTK30971.1 hypothetical protein [Nocardia seriolae]